MPPRVDATAIRMKAMHSQGVASALSAGSRTSSQLHSFLAGATFSSRLLSMAGSAI